MRRESVENLAHRFNSEPEHVGRVAALSLEMFDGLAAAGLHELGDAERELLWAACVLHDIGTAIDYDDHHRHSHYLILNAGLPGFNPRELVLVGLIARYHRKGDPDASELGDLASPGDAERLRLLCAIIRLAEQFERSRDGAIRRGGGRRRERHASRSRPTPTRRATRPCRSGPPAGTPTCSSRHSAARSRSRRDVAATPPAAPSRCACCWPRSWRSPCCCPAPPRPRARRRAPARQWVVNAYLLALAALLPALARIAGGGRCARCGGGRVALAAGAVAVRYGRLDRAWWSPAEPSRAPAWRLCWRRWRRRAGRAASAAAVAACWRVAFALGPSSAGRSPS